MLDKSLLQVLLELHVVSTDDELSDITNPISHVKLTVKPTAVLGLPMCAFSNVGISSQ